MKISKLTAYYCLTVISHKTSTFVKTSKFLLWLSAWSHILTICTSLLLVVQLQDVRLQDENNFALWFSFTRWYLQMHARNPCFPATVLFIDEGPSRGRERSIYITPMHDRRRSHAQKKPVQFRNDFQKIFGPAS